MSNGNYYSPTMDVRDYENVTFRFMSWIDESNVTIQESTDGLKWTDVSTYILPSNNLTYINYKVNGGFVRTVSTADIEVSLMLEE